MTDGKYWFARRFPVGHPRNAMAPVSSEGRLVAWGFVAAVVVGGLGLLFFGMNGQIVAGVAMFVVLALVGGGGFIAMSVGSRGDKQHTVDDYKNRRAGNL